MFFQFIFLLFDQIPVESLNPNFQRGKQYSKERSSYHFVTPTLAVRVGRPFVYCFENVLERTRVLRYGRIFPKLFINESFSCSNIPVSRVTLHRCSISVT